MPGAVRSESLTSIGEAWEHAIGQPCSKVPSRAAFVEESLRRTLKHKSKGTPGKSPVSDPETTKKLSQLICAVRGVGLRHLTAPDCQIIGANLWSLILAITLTSPQVRLRPSCSVTSELSVHRSKGMQS